MRSWGRLVRAREQVSYLWYSPHENSDHRFNAQVSHPRKKHLLSVLWPKRKPVQEHNFFLFKKLFSESSAVILDIGFLWRQAVDFKLHTDIRNRFWLGKSKKRSRADLKPFHGLFRYTPSLCLSENVETLVQLILVRFIFKARPGKVRRS